MSRSSRAGDARGLYGSHDRGETRRGRRLVMVFPEVSAGDGVDGRYDVVVIAAGLAGLLHPDVLQRMRLPSAAHRISASRRRQP